MYPPHEFIGNPPLHPRPVDPRFIPGDPELGTHLARVVSHPSDPGWQTTLAGMKCGWQGMNRFPPSFRGGREMRRPGPRPPRLSGGIPPRANRGCDSGSNGRIVGMGGSKPPFPAPMERQLSRPGPRVVEPPPGRPPELTRLSQRPGAAHGSSGGPVRIFASARRGAHAV